MRDDVIISDGRLADLKEDCLHYDFKNLEAWIAKHNWYSTLEANNVEHGTENSTAGLISSAKTKKIRDDVYYRLPRYFRAKLFYIYRYYFKLGFLDGEPGRVYAFYKHIGIDILLMQKYMN